MMLIHLIIFNIFAVTLLVDEAVSWFYWQDHSDMTYWQAGMTVDSFVFAEYFAYFLLNQFIAYLML